MTASDLFPIFARRETLLRKLSGSTCTKGELVRSLDISRSTVDRTVRRLEKQDIVERRDGGVGFTPTGRLLFNEYRTFADRVDDLVAAQPALSALPPGAPIDPELLVDADVTVADRTTPYRPVERQLDLIDGAERVDLIATVIAPQFVEAYKTQVIDSQMKMRTALCPAVASEIVAEYPDALSELLATDRLSLRTLDTTPPYSLARFEYEDRSCAAVMIHSEDGPQGHIKNDRDEAVSFVTQQFNDYWERADPVHPSDRTSSEPTTDRS